MMNGFDNEWMEDGWRNPQLSLPFIISLYIVCNTHSQFPFFFCTPFLAHTQHKTLD